MIHENNEKNDILNDNCSTVPFNPNIIELKEKGFPFDEAPKTNSNDSAFKYNDLFNQSDNENSGFHFNDTLKFFNIQSDGDKLNMFGFSLRIDTLVIIGIIIFLLFQGNLDIILIICLGLIILDFKLDFLDLFC